MNATATTATTFRAIYTCRNKNCKHVWALDYSVEGTDRYGLPYGTRELKEGERVGGGDKYNGGRRSFSDDVMGDLRCPDCKCNLPKGGRVDGHYSEKHVCGAKCMGATGPSCDCQCGGANRGVNHL
jgi:hypothetical protein